MTNAHLIEALSSAIKKALSGVEFAEEYQREPGELVVVNVFENYLPENVFEETSWLPFVLVELLEVHDDLNAGSSTEIGLTLATFAFEGDGWKDAWHMVELIRRELLIRRVLANRFRLKDLRWEVPGEQPREFYFVTGRVTYDNYLPALQI